MKHIFSVTLLAAVLTAKAQVTPAIKTAPAFKSQNKLVETVEKKSNTDIGIPYKKYALANGATRIIHEDHSDPIVYVDVTYHVG